MRISAPPAQSWQLSKDEVDIIKNHVAKNATDEELKFCLAVARRRKLDPFKQQIWFVKRGDKSAQGGYRWVPMTSIDGLLHVAGRDHKDFGSSDEPEYGPMKEIKWNYYDKSGKFLAPEWARVAMWKKGAQRATVCTVYWDEIYPDVGSSPMVREKPRLMLGKCALAQAIRRAYPDTGGLYIPEEFQGPPEFTPGGRVIEEKQPDCSYCGRNNVPNGCDEPTCPIKKPELQKLTPAQVEVVKEKMQDKPKQASVPAAPSFVYRYCEESEVYEIAGPDELKHAHRELLKPLWSATARKIVATAQQLGKLIAELERRKVPIRAYEEREPGE
jgi:RecT family